MKKIYSFCLISIFILSNFLIASQPEGISVTKSGKKYLINFNLPTYSYNYVEAQGKDFLKIDIPDYGVTTQIGHAMLPQISFNLAITGNESNGRMSLTNLKTKIETVSNEIYPFQQPWQRNLSLKDRPFSYDENYYQSEGNLNAPIFKVSEPFIIGGVTGVTVTIYPFSYNPSENRIKLVEQASFVLDMQNEIESVNNLSDSYNEFLKTFFVNYQPGSSKFIRNYLIIAAPEFEAGLAGFVSHKTGLGYNVTVATTSVAGTTTTAIKSYIQQMYNNTTTKPEFILLVGDVDKIPAWTGTGEGSPKTDLNYAQLEGNDYYADAFVGRFSITSPTQLQRVIEKTLYVENYIGTFQKKNIFMASTDNYNITEGTHNYVISNYFEPAGYTNLKLYTQTYNATTAQLIAALNDNPIFAVYSGHGGETSWADGPVMSQSQVSALTNTLTYPFVYSFACVTGSYHITECFGETWLRAQNGGSAFYGSSVNSYWDEDDILERSLFKAMFTEGISKITPMFDRAKYLMVQHFGGTIVPGETMLRYLEMYNLMGDPSLETKKVIAPDTTAPDAITNLAFTSPTSNSAMLTWTAPYDSTYGGIASYDIRYSTSAINSGNFNAATQIIYGQQSDSAGTLKSYLVNNLNPGTPYYFAIKAQDIWNNNSPISNVITGSTLGAPQITITPSSISHTLEPGAEKTDTVFIRNTSPHASTLNYNIEFANQNYPSKSVQYKLIPMPNNNEQLVSDKDNPIETGGQAIEGQGGPDTFGYKWIDSNEPQGPQYLWNDISTTGTQVTNWVATGTFSATDEGYAGPFTLGFNFKFYGQAKTQVYLSTNGFICFAPLTSNTFTNASIPTATLPNELICPFWDDLDAKAPGTVHYKQEGNKFIIQWTNYQRYSGTSSYTFQVELYSSGKILTYYKTMTGTINSATIGVENADGSVGLQVAKDANYIADNLALKISADPEWAITNSSLSGMLYNNNSAAVVLTFKSEDFPMGNYSMDMVVTSNSSNSSSLTVPIQMTIASIPVELTSFTASTSRDNVTLNWETATETNNRGFSIERKENTESDWKEISFIDGNGTTVEAHSYSYTDKNVKSGKYEYRLKQLDFDGKSSKSFTVEVDLAIPNDFVLEQNYPNPFNPSTKIKFGLPYESDVKITVFNSLGEKVKDIMSSRLSAGYHTVEFNALNLTSGLYFYQIKADKFESIKKMMFLK